MATYEILSTDYAKVITGEWQTNEDGEQVYASVEGDYVKDADGHYVKTVMQVKFTRDDGVESTERVEADGDDQAKIEEQLQATLDEFNARTLN